MCRLEEAPAAEAAVEKERLAKEERERQETRRESWLVVAEFQGQGYSREQAEVLAAKSQRDKSRLERDRQKAEEKALREKEFAVGTSGTCPLCNKHVPISDGIVLFHEHLYSVDGGDGTTWRWEPCPGEGERAWPPSGRYLSQLLKDWSH